MFPPKTGVTEPTPLSIENEVELVVVHESVVELPATIEYGSAESVHVGAGGGGGGEIVMVFSHITVPPLPVAVSLYVCVPTPRGGTKLYEPLSG